MNNNKCSLLFRKTNRTTDSLKMLEKCISLEPQFTPAYLELFKLRNGRSAGNLLNTVVRLTPRNPDHLTQYGNWLFENSE